MYLLPNKSNVNLNELINTDLKIPSDMDLFGPKNI